MLPKKYHAIIFISILVMLLLLGLHLLGIGYSSGSTVSKPTALARNTTQLPSSSSGTIGTALSQNNQAYRYPIVYDKLTGVSNNQINDVLGKQQGQPSSTDYPIDHYQQPQPAPVQRPFGAYPLDGFFNRDPVGSFGPPGHLRGANMMGSLPPPPPQQLLPVGRQSTPQPRVGFVGAITAEAQPDSQPSASSVSSDGATRAPMANGSVETHQLAPLTAQQLRQQPQSLQAQMLQPQPLYYTPPIFAYNAAEAQNRLGEPYAFGPAPQQALAPPLGVPEPPLSIEEYQARQARLRQLQHAQLAPTEPISQSDRYARPVIGQRQGQVPNPDPQLVQLDQNQNLLADPQQQQQRHKQQMLDLLRPDLGAAPPSSVPLNQTSYYPDSSLLYRQPVALMAAVAPNANRAPPYAHNLVNTGSPLESPYGAKPTSLTASQNRPIVPTPVPLGPSQVSAPARLTSTPERAAIKSASGQQVQVSLPACARQASDSSGQLNSSIASQNSPIMLCSEDPEYPTKEIMRALEVYANERTIEQLLPQLLLQIHMAAQRASDSNPGTASRNLMGDLQRQLTLDSLQPSISLIRAPISSAAGSAESGQQVSQGEAISLFPSANYEPMCRSSAYMAQPRRAKNLLGQWKVVVNLPGHKYRGIAISQMLRIEECSRPNSECSGPPQAQQQQQQQQQQQRSSLMANSATTPLPLLPRSRCLQHYENQRLVAWSHQQGLHLDIFRVPIACSCHIRR